MASVFSQCHGLHDLRHRRKTAAVPRRGAVLPQGIQMRDRAVALVGGKAVLGVFGVDLLAPAVAVDFGEDGGGAKASPGPSTM